MKKRGEKSIKELYDLVEKIPNPEITPVLEGSCPIQGPVDESDLEFEGMNVGTLSVEEKYTVMKKSYCTRVESGTCNVCSAPCSSCMHFNRATSVMESNVDGGYTAVKLGRDETDCCSFNVADVHPIHKTRTCDDLQHAASESSNLLSVSSSHDSYSENAESKAALAPNAMLDVSDHVEMPSMMFSGEAGGKNCVLPKVTSVSTHRLSSSSSYSAAVLRQGSLANQNEEQRQIECHGDNISALTGGSDANGVVNLLNADVGRKETTHNVMLTKNVVAEGAKTEPGVKIKEDEIKSLQPSVCLNELLQNRSLGSCIVSADFFSKSDLVDISALKVNSSKGEPSEYLKEKVEFSLGEPMVPGSMEGTMPSSHSGSKDGQMKGNSSSGALESNHPRLETEICKETQNKPNEGLEDVQCGARIDPSEKLSGPMEISKIQGSGKQHQQTNEREHSVSDIEDVKVCDICGDAGREECLAICSRCSDGAEHIYCMRIMMEKVPEGAWLCEECKLKEDAENKKVDKMEELPAVSQFPAMKDNENSERNSNIMPLRKLETKPADLELKGVLKGIQSPKFPTKKHDDNLEVFSMNNKRLSESNDGPMGTASPRKRGTLSRESSFNNLDAEKANPSKTGLSFGNQVVNSPKAFGRPQASPGSNPSKNQTQVQTSRGSLSRSFSFNNSGTKGKVKQLIEKIPSKLKTPKELSPIDVRKVGVIRTMSKNASFPSVGSGRPGAESAIKIQSLNSRKAEDSRGIKQLKERNSLEKKNSFRLGHTLASPSSILNTGIPLTAELKTSHYDGKLNNMSETDNPTVDKGFGDSNDIGCNEGKKQPLNTRKSFGSQSLNNSSSESPKSNVLPSKEGVRSCVDSSNIHTEAVPFCSLPQAVESSLQDEKMKDSHFLSGSRQVGATSCRIVHCQRCNETGHDTQQCSIDKFRVSALKPSAEHNSKELTSKNCKWKAAVEAVVSKSKMQKNIRSQPQESTVASEVESRNLSPNCSSSVRYLTSLESTSDQQAVFGSSGAGPSRTANASDVKQQGIHLGEGSICGARESDVIISNLEELTVKSLGQMHPDCASAFEDPSSVSAIPEFEYIWQGDFEVLGPARLLESFNGVQAHLSTCASPKVLEFVTKFPGKVKLEEVSSGNTWPPQFLRTSAKEDNIALFFFAKDIECYEKNYKKLVENMLTNDLVLRGIIDGVELLIFPSNKLPEKSQRWNNLFFLWGVFRERSIDCLNSFSSLPKPCKSSYEMEPLVSGSVYPLAREVTISKIELLEIPEKTLPKLETSQQVKAAEPRTDVDILPVSTSGIKDTIFQTQAPLHIQALGHTMGMPQTNIKSCADSRVRVNASQLCLEQESVVTHVRNLSSDPEGGRGVGLQNNVQFSLSKHGALPLSPIHWFLENGKEGSECGFRKNEMREKEALVKSEVVLGDDQHRIMPTTDHLSCEPKPLRKRVSSWLVDSALHVSGDTSKATDGTKLLKESLDSMFVNDEKENKKVKLYAEGQASSCGFIEENMSGRLSSKVHPLLGSFSNEQQHTDDIYSEPMMVAESSRSAERCLFPVDLNSASGAEVEEVIHVLSSDDEDTRENNSPDLELALGGKKPPAKQEMLPLFFPLFDRTNNQNKMPADPGDDDVPASLSLSLSFPVPGKEQRAKPLLKTEQLLPERPCVNTSLLLFGGFSDN